MTPGRENRWEEFAKENAEHYIWTDYRDYRDPRAMEAFMESGRVEVDEIMTVAGDRLAHRGSALEIGCGVGRLTLPVARRFEHVFALDISPTMLRRLGEYCESNSVTNVTPILSTGSWATDIRADLVYSRLVFQHIESLDEIGRYVTGAAACLEEGGLAYLQFDTRPRRLAYRAKALAPDWALPSRWRRGIRRIRRSPPELRALFDRAGFSVVDELRPRSADHAFVLERREGGDGA